MADNSKAVAKMWIDVINGKKSGFGVGIVKTLSDLEKLKRFMDMVSPEVKTAYKKRWLELFKTNKDSAEDVMTDKLKNITEKYNIGDAGANHSVMVFYKGIMPIKFNGPFDAKGAEKAKKSRLKICSASLA